MNPDSLTLLVGQEITVVKGMCMFSVIVISHGVLTLTFTYILHISV